MLRSLIFPLLLLLNCILYGQSTKELFSIPGLSINADYTTWFNDPDPLPLSYQFMEEVELCSKSVLRYMNTHTHENLYLYIEEEKVFYLNINTCQTKLHYDFGASIGDTISSGTYEGFVVDSITQIELVNGEHRKSLNITHPSLGKFPSEYTTILIEGIGDLLHGLIFALAPGFEGGGSVLHCVTVGDESLVNDFNFDYLAVFDFTEEEIQEFSDRARAACFELSCIHPKIDYSIEQQNDTLYLIDKSQYFNELTWYLENDVANPIALNFQDNKIALPDDIDCFELRAEANAACTDSIFVQNFSISSHYDRKYNTGFDIFFQEACLDVIPDLNSNMEIAVTRYAPNYTISLLNGQDSLISTIEHNQSIIDICKLDGTADIIRFQNDSIPQLLFEHYLERVK